MTSFRKNKVMLRVACLFVAMSFLSNAILPGYVRAEISLPAPTQFVPLSSSYSFPILKGLSFNPNKPMEMEFIIDTADQKKVSQAEAAQLIKYFLAGLTIPENELWVNMSPYEKDKMIAPALSETDLGKDMLSQDYLLKQISSSLTYPESQTGKDFWAKTYQEVQKIAHSTKLPVNTFNKIWIMPDKAVVFEHENFALVKEASLKTMLEQDYIALKNNTSDIQKQNNAQQGLINKVSDASSKVMKEVILPKINNDVNSGKNFSTLRQIYYSLILATWFKQKFSDSIYKNYIDKAKVKGIDLNDKNAKEKIYNLYVEAFKTGLYNYVKPEVDPGSHKKIKRQYFSGGLVFPLGKTVATEKVSASAISEAAQDIGTNDMVIRIEGNFLKGNSAASAVANDREIQDMQRQLRNLNRAIKRASDAVYSNKYTGDALEKRAERLTELNNERVMLQGKLDKALQASAGSALGQRVRTIEGLKDVIGRKNFDSAMIAADWNVSVSDGNINDDTRIRNSIPTLKTVINDLSVNYLYLFTHSGRPKGKGYEEAYSLKPMADRAREFLASEGVNAEVVLLSYDLAEAQKTIEEYKQANPGKKVIFVFENIRFYAEEKAKEVKGRTPFEQKLISLTGRTAENLIYINEAFDKSHRGSEASMEMVKLIPAENRAAGVSLQEEINKALEFESRVTGSLNAIFGGAKFDKYANIGEVADRVEKTDGKLIVVGALANPLLVSQGKDMGDSLMPQADEAKDVNVAINALADPSEIGSEIEEDATGFKVITPVDFQWDGDKQVDIGTETIARLRKFFDSLKPGDGVILNGGAGMFENPKSRTGTRQMILLAEAAAERGVIVFAAGGDMNVAIKTIENDLGKTVSAKIIRSTGGGVLLEVLAKGLMALPALSSLVDRGQDKDEVPASALVPAFLKEALPGAVILAPSVTVPKDTSTGPVFSTGVSEEMNRDAALDLRATNIGINVEIPEADNPSEILYPHFGVIPVVIPKETVSRALKIRIGKKGTDEKNVTTQVITYLQEKANKVGLPIFDQQARSNKLEDKGDFVLDIASNIGVYNLSSGDLLVHIPFWAKDMKAVQGLKDFFAKEKELTDLPSNWDKDVSIANSREALDFLGKNAPRFFEELSKGNRDSADLLTSIINTLHPEYLLAGEMEGIEYDPVLGLFISQNDKNASEKFMSKNLEAFLSKVNTIEQLATLVYFLTVPNFDQAAGKGVAVNDPALQKAAVRFYYQLYKSLDVLATRHFGDAQVFEPLRRQIGVFANALNKAIAKNNAIDVNNSSADVLIGGLIQQGVKLSDAEISNLVAVYAAYQGKPLWYDLLQLSEILNENNFSEAFTLLKMEEPKVIMPEDRPYEAYDGTGRIARIALAFRFVADLNGRNNSSDYTGRYLVRSRALKGQTRAEKFNFALTTLRDMLNDDVIKASDLTVKLSGKEVRFSQLLSEGRVTFAASDEVLAAKQDFKQQTAVESVYPVNILIDGKVVGVTYFLDNKEFSDGLKSKGVSSYNIPRPFIVSDKQDIYFGAMIDATPGGVEIVGLTEADATAKGIKVSGPTAFEMVGIDKVEVPGYKLDSGSELAALRDLAAQVKQDRLAEGKSMLYLKAQIPKMLLPLGGGINLSGEFAYKLPRVQDTGFRYMSPTSCSTNGASHLALYLSVLAGLGQETASILGTTYHMYTSGDKKGPFGHLNPKSTGAAKGVKQHLSLENALFTSVRTPTAFKNGSTDILGGSVFDLLIQLPYAVKKEVVVNFLERVSSEFPDNIKVFGKESEKSGAYRWKDTITGQATGSIIYPDLITQVDGRTLRLMDGYDNEFSYSTKMNKLMETYFELSDRQKDKVKRQGLIMASSSISNDLTSQPVKRISAGSAVDALLQQVLGTPSLEVVGRLLNGQDLAILRELKNLLNNEAQMAFDKYLKEEEPYADEHDQWLGLQAKCQNIIEIIDGMIEEQAKFVVSEITPSETTTLGSPTVRLDMKLAGGAEGYFTVPAGTSTGKDEAKTVGVKKAIENLSIIIAKVREIGLRVNQVVEIGRLMLSMDKDQLGAEATLSFQMASAWAAAKQKGLQNYEFLRELAPDLASKGVPKTAIQYNITNGGEHADNSLDMQEFMIVTHGKTTAEENRMCDQVDRQLGLIYQALGLKADPDDKGVGKLRGKEGGYKVEDLTIERLQEIYKNADRYSINNLDLRALDNEGVGVHEFVLNCLVAAIKNAGYTPSNSKEVGTVALALDTATTSMLVEGHQNLYSYEGRQINAEELIGIYSKWIEKYPIDSIEDGLGEDDWDGWVKLIKAIGDKVRLIGDDNLVTQGGRLSKLISLLKENGLVDAQGKVTKKLGILIKLNQNGFLTTGINNPNEGYLGTLEVIRLAKQYGIESIISHRSKEAEPKDKEVSIADLAAAVDAYALKSGDHVQDIRAIKEDRLAEIDNRERAMASSSAAGETLKAEIKQTITQLTFRALHRMGAKPRLLLNAKAPNALLKYVGDAIVNDLTENIFTGEDGTNYNSEEAKKIIEPMVKADLDKIFVLRGIDRAHYGSKYAGQGARGAVYSSEPPEDSKKLGILTDDIAGEIEQLIVDTEEDIKKETVFRQTEEKWIDALFVDNGLKIKASSSLDVNPGGIDMANINVGATPNSIPVNLPAIELNNIQGFSFRIIGMQPITNSNRIFGSMLKVEEPNKKEQKLAYLKN